MTAATRHHLAATPETVHWGVLNAALSPRAEIAPGEVIRIETVSGQPGELPGARDPGTVRPDLTRIHDRVVQGLGPHILTGPVYVTGAKPGDMLRVDILAVDLLDDWGYSITRAGKGVLPELAADAPSFFGIDRNRGTITTPWGPRLTARPFFGIMAVAPAPGLGPVTTVMPGPFAGNIDNKELIPGTTIFVPVQTEGALFSVGDGHAVQGDGEVCLTAVETGLAGTFRLDLDRNGPVTLRPYARTPTHLITMAFDEDLGLAAKIALSDMVAHVSLRLNIAPSEAYRLCSLIADLRVTQMVNVRQGIHVMVPLSLLGS